MSDPQPAPAAPRPALDPGDDVSSMCVNLRILSRLAAGEKLCSVKDRYYVVQDGTTYQAAVLRYLRQDSRESTCAAIEVRLTRCACTVCCCPAPASHPSLGSPAPFFQTLFARVAAANSTNPAVVPRDLIASASRGLAVLMKTYAQDKQVVSRLEQVQQRYCSAIGPTGASLGAETTQERAF